MTTQATPDMKQMGDELYKHWERAMGSWWDQVLETPAFLGAMGQNLEAMAGARGHYEKAVDEAAERMHLPSRSDVVRVAKVASMLEERLLQQEDLVLGLKDQMVRLEREAVQARIEAAEARIELRETLADIRAQLGGLSAGAPVASALAPAAAAPPAPSAPRSAKPRAR